MPTILRDGLYTVVINLQGSRWYVVIWCQGCRVNWCFLPAQYGLERVVEVARDMLRSVRLQEVSDGV